VAFGAVVLNIITTSCVGQISVQWRLVSSLCVPHTCHNQHS